VSFLVPVPQTLASTGTVWSEKAVVARSAQTPPYAPARSGFTVGKPPLVVPGDDRKPWCRFSQKPKLCQPKKLL
jgi:hypothetical protein